MGKRIQIDLFIPKAVYGAIPTAKKQAAVAAIRDLKALAVRVGEEMTVKATIHNCYHDEGLNHPPCGSEQDI